MKKNLRGPFCILLAALIALLSFPAGAAGAIVAAGECGGDGSNVTWTLDKEGLLTISGTGTMYDYAAKEDVPWYSYRTQVKKAEIQKGVTSVGQNAFRDCTALASVTLPEGLKSIQNVAFYNCAALTQIAIPEGVETIGESAFGFCALITVAIPASVTSIGESVFYRCSALTAITVADANEKYSSENGVLFNKVDAGDAGGGEEGGGSAGEGGESGEGGGSAGEGGESGEGGGSGGGAANKTLLICYPVGKTDAEYTVPGGIETIGSHAFHSAMNLKRVTLPEGVKVIASYAFAYSVLGGDETTVRDGIDIPKSLTVIEEGAFYECRGLSTTGNDNLIKITGRVNFGGSRKEWNEVDIKDKNACLTNADIVYADMKQDNIIASGECGNKGSNAVWSLTDKGEFTISGTGVMSNYSGASSVPWANYLASGATEAQDLRDNILTVTIEGNSVEAGAVTKYGITNVGDYAFSDCVNLERVTFKAPSNVKTIGAQTFSNCAKLTSVNLSATAAASIGDYAFNGTAALESVTFPDKLLTIGKQAFLRSGLTSVTIPASVTSVGDWAFRWCEHLTSFAMEPLETGVTPHKSAIIGNHALANCAALTTADFTENLANLGEYAFADCEKLTGSADSIHHPNEIYIPANVFNIGSCAFHGCAALKAINVDDDNLTYCSVILDKSTNQTKSSNTMLMNKDRTCIYYYPTGRTEKACDIPESVISVAPFAFDGADALENVVYEGTKSQWEALTEANLPEGEERTRIGPFNEPLLNAAVTWQPDPDDSEYITKVMNVDVDTTKHQLTVVVHCGLNAETEDAEDAQGGTYVFCAIYGKDKRFLRLDMPDTATVLAADDDGEETETAQSLTPGTDTELTYTWDEDTGLIRLLILDENHLPRCKNVEQEISEEEAASPGEA